VSSFNFLASGSFARNTSEVTPRKFAPSASAVVDVIASAILRGEVFNFASETTGAVRVSSLLVVSPSSSSFARLLTSGVFRPPLAFFFSVQR
jgi:hypothetical protein